MNWQQIGVGIAINTQSYACYDQIPENVSGRHSEPAIFTTIGGGFQLQFAGGGCDRELGEVWRGCPPDDPNHNTIIIFCWHP